MKLLAIFYNSIILWIILSSTSIAQLSPNIGIEIIDEKENEERMKGHKTVWKQPKDYSPISFLEHVLIDDDKNEDMQYAMMMDDFPIGWVKDSDIDTLMTFIDSEDKCYCFVSPLSSYLPIAEKANLGGYAIIFINSFRRGEKVSMGLHNCPQTDSAISEDIKQWWRQSKKSD